MFYDLYQHTFFWDNFPPRPLPLSLMEIFLNRACVHIASDENIQVLNNSLLGASDIFD